MSVTSAWHPEAAKSEDGSKASGNHSDLLCLHGSQVSSWHGAAAWTTDSNLVSGGIQGHNDPSKRYNPDSELLLISGLRGCLEPKVGSGLSPLKLQVVAHHLATVLDNDSK